MAKFVFIALIMLNLPHNGLIRGTADFLPMKATVHCKYQTDTSGEPLGFFVRSRTHVTMTGRMHSAESKMP